MSARGAIIALVLACLSALPQAAQAAFPGGNGQLAFVSARSGFPADNDLYTMNADGTAQTRITSFDQDELYPSWARNGAKLVFQQDPGLHAEIWVANPDGTGLQRLTDNAWNDTHPALSPNGTKVVFASDRAAAPGVPDLFVMNSDGTGQVNITNTPTVAEDFPAWSPDGLKLAFSREGDIYTAAPDGSGAAQLTQTPEVDVEPDWSPGGSQIVFHAGVGSNDEIWKMGADGSGKTNLTNNGATVEERPVWSPAGDKIAFTRGAFDAAEVYTMNPDGSGQTRITNNTVIDAQPAWQPVPPPPGTVTVRVDSVPDDPQDWSYTALGLDDGFAWPPTYGPTTFALDDDANATLANQRTFTGVTPGSGYSVTQTAVAGWDTTSATCSDGSSPASISVSSGEDVTCTFSNRKRGRIDVVLNTVPNGPQDFGFTASGGLSPTSFALDDDSDGALPNTRTFSNLVPAAGYSVTQNAMPPGGWAQASATCSDGSPVSNVSVSAGETVTCTFVNHQPGHIVVVNDTQPNDAQDFGYTAGGGLLPASFQLDDDGSDATLERMRTFDVMAGSGFWISQAVPAGWMLGSAACSDGSPLSNITVSPNETVICTYRNLKRGRISLVTSSQPDDPQDFAYTAGGGLSPASFSLDDDADATLPRMRTFQNVAPGPGYSLAGTVPPGWDRSSATCDDGSDPTNIQVSAGETVKCTFAHRKRGQVVIVQDTTPDHPQDFAFSADGGLSPTSFSLDDDSDATLSNTRVFADVKAQPGYSVSPSMPAGWDLTAATCDDGTSPSAIDVSPAETVTCTFAARKQGSLTIAADMQPDDEQDLDFTAGPGLDPATFQLDDDSDAALPAAQVYANVAAGTYSASQSQVPAGWDLASATCSDGSPASAIDIGVGEDVTCTFTNRKRGQIVVVKDAQPDDPQDFAFTASGGLSPTSFALDDDSDGALSNTRTFADVAPGSGYSIAETTPPGWASSSASCSDGSPAGDIDLAPGEVVTCTFASEKRGSITVLKEASPQDAQDFGFTAGGGLSPASFTLDDDSDGALSNTRTFADVTPGSGYSLAEATPSGWQQVSATCDDGSPVSDIDVAPGEAVTCTFFNRKPTKIVVVLDAQPNDPQDFSFTAGGGLSPTSFQLDDDGDATLARQRVFKELTPGSGYSLAQTLPAGWLQISATCSDGSPVTNVNVSEWETVTCTFVNQRGYPRPQGATPLMVALVPAFAQCASPNRTHGPSLASPSCNPPSAASPHLTTGTPDANGQPAKMVGAISFKAQVGNAGTPADEADVTITASITDVRVRSTLGDYAGELQGSVTLRITNRLNGSSLNEPATGSDVAFPFTIPCSATPESTTVGSTCAIATSADAVVPGAVTELKRSIWRMSDVSVSDGGADGDASTADNSPYLRQGIFVP